MIHIKSEKLRNEIMKVKCRSKSFLFWEACVGSSEYLTNGRYIDSLKEIGTENPGEYSKDEEVLCESLSLPLKTNKYVYAKFFNLQDRYIGFAMAEKNISKLETDRETAALIVLNYHMRVKMKGPEFIGEMIIIGVFVSLLVMVVTLAVTVTLPTAGQLLFICCLLAILAYVALEYFYVSHIAPKLLADFSDKSNDLPGVQEFLKEDSIVEDTFGYSTNPILAMCDFPQNQPRVLKSIPLQTPPLVSI